MLFLAPNQQCQSTEDSKYLLGTETQILHLMLFQTRKVAHLRSHPLSIQLFNCGYTSPSFDIKNSSSNHSSMKVQMIYYQLEWSINCLIHNILQKGQSNILASLSEFSRVFSQISCTLPVLCVTHTF